MNPDAIVPADEPDFTELLSTVESSAGAGMPPLKRNNKRVLEVDDAEYFAGLQEETGATSGSQGQARKRSERRAGKWTVEEEVYSEFLIAQFVKGALTDCEENTTLRAYLADKLNSKPMRITKKYATADYDGKIAFHRTNSASPDPVHLAALRDNYLQSMMRPKAKRSHKKTSSGALGGQSSFSSEQSCCSTGDTGGESTADSGLVELEIMRSPIEPDSAESSYSEDDLDGQLTPEDIEMIKEAFE